MKATTAHGSRLALAALSAVLLLAGCSSDNTASTGNTSTSSAVASTAAASAGSSAPSSAKKVDANKASQSELVSALEANGLPSAQAQRWAREIEEYRPYPTDDPSLQKLKDNLKKYNPSADALDKILASLTV